MNFISWGDFNIPFTWGAYWAKHFYMWSFQSGTPNPDGLIRLPGRIFHFLVFGATDNVITGYFYLFASLAIAFIAFFLFARKFLQIKQTSIQIIGALFFACNPIFLGNLAKVGLVLAVAMLPLALLAIRTAFVQRKLRFLLLWIVCLNISFLHPYTFTVNAAVTFAYFMWMAWQHRAWVRDIWYKFIFVGLFAVGLNLYFVLPMASMGTVSKDVISTNITPVAVDYTALVGISNTRDLFTGLSLSKNVFVDFSFYDSIYQNVYFFGVFLFYVIIFGLYLHAERHLGLADKRRLGILFAAFLVLIALAATTIANIDSLIKFLIGMPGGWAFRSPLKWQLYIPLALFSIMVILLSHVRSRGRLFGLQAGLIVTFLIMNGFLVLDIGAKILRPRPVQFFAGLQQLDTNNKTVLFVNNGMCMNLMRSYPVITTELNQVFTSKNTQLKHVLEDNADSVNFGSYDYVLGCFDQLEPMLTQKYNFEAGEHFVERSFQLYKNTAPPPSIGVSDQIVGITPTAMANKYDFATNQLDTLFQFLDKENTHPTTQLLDVFETVRPDQLKPGALTTTIDTSALQSPKLQIRDHESLFARTENAVIRLADKALPGFEPITRQTIELPSAQAVEVRLEDPAFAPGNLIPNNSFEQGLWEEKVTDCYAYDDQPMIGMRLINQEKTDGQQALELAAQAHIACTGPPPIAVEPGAHYLLSFDYQSPDGGKFAGYYLSFDDETQQVQTGRMQNKDSSWQQFSKEITVPAGAKTLRLMLYAFPDSYGEKLHAARYDNVHLTKIPPAQDRFYAVSQPKTELKTPASMSYSLIDPTRKTVKIEGASKPFYLTTTETYHPQWQAKIGKTKVTEADHVKLNNTMNAWHINPEQLCQTASCTKHEDGTYSFSMQLVFAPQRWFYVGAAISCLTLAAGAIYFAYERTYSEKYKEGRWRWRKK